MLVCVEFFQQEIWLDESANQNELGLKTNFSLRVFLELCWFRGFVKLLSNCHKLQSNFYFFSLILNAMEKSRRKKSEKESPSICQVNCNYKLHLSTKYNNACRHQAVHFYIDKLYVDIIRLFFNKSSFRFKDAC